MTDTFDKGPYLSLVKQQEHFSTDKKITEKAESELQFQYVQVSSEQFFARDARNKKPESTATILAQAAFAGILETIYHVAKGLLVGIPNALSGHGEYLLVHIFYVARDLQESFGRIASLFDKQYGQFHIEESRFHKTCYDIFLAHYSKRQSVFHVAPHEYVFSRGYESMYGVMVDMDAKKVSFLDYKNMSIEERNEVMVRFSSYRDQANNLGQSGKTLDAFVNEHANDELQSLTFQDLAIPLEFSTLKYALMRDDVFNALPINELPSDLRNSTTITYIQTRMKKLISNSAIDFKEIDFKEFDKILVKDLYSFKPEHITDHKDQIPVCAFTFFSNEQLEGVSLSGLIKKKIEALFFALSEDEIKSRLKLFGTDDVMNAVQKGLLARNVLCTLGFEYLVRLPLSKVPSKTLNEWFCKHYGSDAEELEQADKKQFRNFDSDEAVNAVRSGAISTRYQLGLYSKEQLRKIPLSELPKETLNDWFRKHYGSDAEELEQADKDLVINFDSDETVKAIKLGVISTRYQLGLCSKEQVRKIPLSELPKETLNDWFRKHYGSDAEELEQADKDLVDCFDSDEVVKAIRLQLLTTEYQKQLLSDQQKNAIPLSMKSKEELKKMGPTDLEQFELKEVKEALEAEAITIEQIPTVHLKAFDFSTMDLDLIKTVMPSSSVEDLRRKHTYYHHDSHFAMRNGIVLVDKREGYYCEYTEEQLQKLSQEQQ